LQRIFQVKPCILGVVRAATSLQKLLHSGQCPIGGDKVSQGGFSGGRRHCVGEGKNVLTAVIRILKNTEPSLLGTVGLSWAETQSNAKHTPDAHQA
jgi:hypothetical protein